MDKQRLHKIILDLKDIIEELECEVLSDSSSYLKKDYDYNTGTYTVYDYDDDGYCD